MKRFLSLLLSLLLLFSLCACGFTAPVEQAGQTFTDDLGRQVILPEQIDKVAVSGTMAQIVVFALCPEKMVGVAAPIPLPGYEDLPMLGQLYGGKGELNLETLLQSGAQVIIDVGEQKDSMAEELDALQEETGIPFVHIDASLATYAQAFRTLGAMLGLSEQAEPLANYCENAYDTACALADSVEKISAVYVTGDAGQNVIAKGSFQGEVMDLLTHNAAVVDAPSAKGTGNEVSMEQLMLWDPEVIIFSPDSIYARVADDPVWQTLTAVQTGRYYEAPSLPYNWMGFPPGVQRCLGLLWLGKALYPENADYDLSAKAAEFYELFYHCRVTSINFPF